MSRVCVSMCVFPQNATKKNLRHFLCCRFFVFKYKRVSMLLLPVWLICETLLVAFVNNKHSCCYWRFAIREFSIKQPLKSKSAVSSNFCDTHILYNVYRYICKQAYFYFNMPVVLSLFGVFAVFRFPRNYYRWSPPHWNWNPQFTS